ncbi:hypothetical protein WPS_02860 [Vulcanimicrobium alpinum]|uniref:Uncharacterized protein n=1 Tax=Vulcanimicrobium alpinum TaxID=3016050 RepID=A0AAN2C7N1_UNVUL|nr:hypothetical protein [Vulcanimicrobium alpinum]BDE05010.1 hypothetical protein WPS_02860 [Vulcanimicrobium alpinum]
MIPTSSAAEHLADLDARFEAHAEALRAHAGRLRDALARAAGAPAAATDPLETEPLSHSDS